MTSFSKDGGRKTKKTISHSFNNHHDNYNAIRAVTPAVRGAELMQSMTLPKMSKDEMPKLCLMKIVSIDEIELNNKKQQQQQQESAVCMVLKPLVAEGIDGAAIYHNYKPTRNEEGILEYQEFISYTGEALPEKFTIWASKAHKKLIQSGAWMNAQECYLCIQPTVNRFHPNNMYQKNVSLNYRIYMSADISDILIDMGEEGPFSETNKVHLNILLEEMIAASMKTLISNKAACSRFNKSKSRPVESDMRPMVRNGDKLTRKHFFLASLEPEKRPQQQQPINSSSTTTSLKKKNRKRSSAAIAAAANDSSSDSEEDEETYHRPAAVKKSKKKKMRRKARRKTRRKLKNSSTTIIKKQKVIMKKKAKKIITIV